MDQCTFGARPLRGGHERRGSRTPKNYRPPDGRAEAIEPKAYGRLWTGFALIAATFPAEWTRRFPSSF